MHGFITASRVADGKPTACRGRKLHDDLPFNQEGFAAMASIESATRNTPYTCTKRPGVVNRRSPRKAIQHGVGNLTYQQPTSDRS